jgi:hypothetical protein
MNPAVKYTLGRIGLFVVVLVVLLPVPLNFLIKAMLAVIASAAFSYFLLRKWRDEMAEQLGAVAEKRAAEKQRLRDALAGEETAAESAKPAGPAEPTESAEPTGPAKTTATTEEAQAEKR